MNPQAFTPFFEGAMIAMLGTWSGIMAVSEAITEKDWQKIKGPEGALFLCVIIILTLWNSGRVREKNENLRREKEEKSRELRHAEGLKLQRENAEKLMNLTAESIKAHGMSVGAIKSVDRTLMNLTEELKERPCQKLKP